MPSRRPPGHAHPGGDHHPGPRAAARPEVEVLLLRRQRRASFMANTFVFPGGRIDAADGGAEVAAIRELFEEAGVLLATRRRRPRRRGELDAWRRRLLTGETSFAAVLEAAGLQPDVARLRPWAR